MPISPSRWFKRIAEFKPKNQTGLVPKRTRGLYVLFHFRRGLDCYDVVYVGLAKGAKTGVGGRLRAHTRSKTKASLWSHFSVFEVWDNITEQEVAELEGLFRHIYRKDTKANRLNLQKSFEPLKRIRKDDLSSWKNTIA